MCGQLIRLNLMSRIWFIFLFLLLFPFKWCVPTFMVIFGTLHTFGDPSPWVCAPHVFENFCTPKGFIEKANRWSPLRSCWNECPTLSFNFNFCLKEPGILTVSFLTYAKPNDSFESSMKKQFHHALGEVLLWLCAWDRTFLINQTFTTKTFFRWNYCTLF